MAIGGPTFLSVISCFVEASQSFGKSGASGVLLVLEPGQCRRIGVRLRRSQALVVFVKLRCHTNAPHALEAYHYHQPQSRHGFPIPVHFFVPFHRLSSCNDV